MEKEKSINYQIFIMINTEVVELGLSFSIPENEALLVSGHKKLVEHFRTLKPITHYHL